MIMKLYHYFRSSASYRLRIALNYKKLQYESIGIHLVNNGGEQHSESYKTLNPQQLVPALSLDDNNLSQSLAIIEYLEERYPSPPLLPSDALARCHVRSLALHIACDIHPLNNLRVLQYLTTTLGHTEEQKMEWYHHWLKLGFDALEQQLHRLPRSIAVCYGDEPSIADVCLIPQVYNANRFNFALTPYPLICKINDYCSQLPAFAEAAPQLELQVS